MNEQDLRGKINEQDSIGYLYGLRIEKQYLKNYYFNTLPKEEKMIVRGYRCSTEERFITSQLKELITEDGDIEMPYEKSPSCSCEECVSSCRHRPGWFLPGEAEKVAKYLKISMKELYEKYLVMDYFGQREIDVLSPGSLEEHGHKASIGFAFRGSQCIFLNSQDRCSIYSVRPFECAVAHHGNRHKLEGFHHWVAQQWRGKDVWQMIEGEAKALKKGKRENAKQLKQ